jgi:hypothetical protein
MPCVLKIVKHDRTSTKLNLGEISNTKIRQAIVYFKGTVY